MLKSERIGLNGTDNSEGLETNLVREKCHCTIFKISWYITIVIKCEMLFEVDIMIALSLLINNHY